jgi:PAS domain S-box-containing protein
LQTKKTKSNPRHPPSKKHAGVAKPPAPENEAARLEALRQYEILDTAPERAFDDIARLASQICGTPVALISLVDEKRQWYKARHGTTLEGSPREAAFCAHGIAESDVFVVHDARTDARFAANPLVTDSPGIQFYAGAQLVTPQGAAIGMLCVHDFKPRQLTPEQIEALRVLARQTVTQLELRRHVVEIERTWRQRQQAEEARRKIEARIRQMFENTNEGIFQSSVHGRWLLANPACARILGYETPEALTANTSDIAHQFYAEPERREEFKRQLAEHQRVQGFEARFLRRDGARIWISISARAILKDNGEVECYEGIVNDITARKEAEEALRRAHEELETRVAERTTELRVANAALTSEIRLHKEVRQALETAQKQLAETSRQAGKAELATEILHNVGNVISSINTSSATLLERVRASKGVNLSKAIDLLEKHAHDLPDFLASHPKGKMLMPYLSSLAAYLRNEQQDLLEELQSMERNVEHIKEVVTLQQSYAKTGGSPEPIQLGLVVDEALRLNATALKQYSIQVQRTYTTIPPALVEKHKVLQIVVNFIRNAQQALEHNAPEDRKIAIRLASPAAGRVLVSVSDNGAGIAAKNLKRIGEHGFTTRRDGHGFGLHSCINAARELGGQVTIKSDGPGNGATFTLELPCEPAETKEA